MSNRKLEIQEKAILLQKQPSKEVLSLTNITPKERYSEHDIPFRVRGSPYGSCLTKKKHSSSSSRNYNDEDIQTRHREWKRWRKINFHKVYFPVEGFDHIHTSIEEEEAEQAARIMQKGGEDTIDHDGQTDGREYGAIRSPLDAPIGSLKDKWRVLPHFLSVRSLMRQHIDSFDYFVNTEMKEIVQSPSACEIRSDHDPKFYLRYTDCWVGSPSLVEDSHADTQATPFQCRLRDATYSAPIYVDLRYTRGRQIVVKKKVRLFSINLFVRLV